jgi:hypothetical protein
MLSDLRERVLAAFAQADRLALVTYGPAGLQLSLCPCGVLDKQLYVRVIQTSEHLPNLEQDSRVLAVTDTWRLRAHAEPVTDALTGSRLNQQAWETLLRLQPISMEFINPDGQTASETIDLDP